MHNQNCNAKIRHTFDDFRFRFQELVEAESLNLGKIWTLNDLKRDNLQNLDIKLSRFKRNRPNKATKAIWTLNDLKRDNLQSLAK